MDYIGSVMEVRIFTYDPLSPLNIQSYSETVGEVLEQSVNTSVETESQQPTFNDMIHWDDNRDASTSNPPCLGKRSLLDLATS